MRKVSTLSMMTASLALTAALAGCSKAPPRERSDEALEAVPPRAPAAADMAAEGTQAFSPPAIGPTAAPGVAFNYRYDFRLDSTKIGPVQEKHAAACEALGVDRCRITGMSYRLVDDRDIAGMLAFKLEPALAREFGKKGIAAVTEAEGMLVRSEISGVDAGSQIDSAARAEARLRAERTRLEAQLKALPAGDDNDDEREILQSRLNDIARQLESSSAGREANEESLATTPMVFNYGSGEVVPGFDARSPLREAFRTAGETVIGAIAVLIVVVSALLPFAVLVGLALLLWKAIAPRIARRTRPAEPAPPAETL